MYSSNYIRVTADSVYYSDCVPRSFTAPSLIIRHDDGNETPEWESRARLWKRLMRLLDRLPDFVETGQTLPHFVRQKLEERFNEHVFHHADGLWFLDNAMADGEYFRFDNHTRDPAEPPIHVSHYILEVISPQKYRTLAAEISGELQQNSDGATDMTQSAFDHTFGSSSTQTSWPYMLSNMLDVVFPTVEEYSQLCLDDLLKIQAVMIHEMSEGNDEHLSSYLDTLTTAITNKVNQQENPK